LNRAVQSQYAPASIFKILVAAAALQEGSLTPADRTQCTGEFHLGTATFKDWKEGGHGTVDLQRAIVQSCNIFFYQAGLKDGGVVYSDAGQVNGHVELSPVVWEFLRRSLWAAVNDGTGAAARIPGLDIAGKTGTAQIIGKSKATLGQDHAWFAAFAPVKNPE